MERIKKYNFNLKVLFILAIAIFSLIFFSNVNAASYTIDDYKIDAKIKADGDMHVEEYLKYSFSEDMNGLFRDLLYKYNFKSQKDNMEATSSRYQASSVSNINAYISDKSFNDLTPATLEEESSLSNGVNGYFSVTDVESDGYRKNIKVYSPVSSGKSKYVKYEYDIEDVAVKYNDAGEIYWNFVGKDWKCDIGNVEINISFENAVNDESSIKVYPHSYTKDIQYNVSENNIKITGKNIDSGIALDARVVFPGDLLVSSTKVINENYDFSTLDKIENKMTFDRNRYFVANTIYVIVLIGGIIGLITIIVESNKIINKGKKKGKNIEIYTEILDKYSLSEYINILDMYGGITNNNLFLATILDLSNRKYILMEPQKKLKKELFSSIEYNYNMKLNAEKDYSELNEYEISIINYLFNGEIGNITNITNFKKQSIELNERLKELSKDYKNRPKYAKFCEEFNRKETEKIYTPIPKKLIKGVVTFIAVYILVLLINTFVVAPIVPPVAIVFMIISIFICVFTPIFTSSAKSLKEEYVDEYNRLIGLRKYLKEYSLLKDRYPIEIALWDKYLVFASLFGIADKVAKEFKEELIAQGYDDDYIFMTYACLNMSAHSSYVTSAFASSTGTSSSGGYSGGGSGGGGGRRRRWRSLLKNNYKIRKSLYKGFLILLNLYKNIYVLI